MGYSSAKQMAQKWGITPQRVTELCRSGAVRGAWRAGRSWHIPEDAAKPERVRRMAGAAASATASASGQPASAAPRIPVPIGISSYERIITSRCASVDKTLLVKEVLDRGTEITMFLRPRRFGKTLNMDMLRCFFEKAHADTSHLFRSQLIWQQGSRYTDEQGKYPTVWVSLKDARGLSWDFASVQIAQILAAEYDRHPELADSSALTPRERTYYSRITSGEAPEALLGRALLNLTAMLRKHHGMPVVLFIDEYDTPIQEGYLHGYYDEVVSLMRVLVSSAVKDNPNLYRGFLSGVTRVAKESIFSGLNNLFVDSMLGGGFAPYFGFTYDETKELLAKFGREDMFGVVIDWYDGYRIDGMELVNPWSVNNFINLNYVPQGYWQQTGSSEIIRQIVEAGDSAILDKMYTLVGGDQVEEPVNDGVAYPQVAGEPSAVFGFLLMAGYLRVDERRQLADGTWLSKLSIPNKEIRQAYAREVIAAGVSDIITVGLAFKGKDVAASTLMTRGLG